MATRRPKVPRATPAAPQSADAGDGGDVIQADFGGHGPSGPAPAQHGAAPPGGQAPAAKSSGAKSAAAKNTAAKSAPAKSTGAKPGGMKTSGTGKPPAEPDDAPVPAKAFSGRMLALAVVMIAITIMLAPTVKIFFEKRAEIAALQADISAKQAQQNDLRRQVSRWQDPNYVKQQARDRINMVMPGETGYWVFGSDLPAGGSGGAAGAASTQDPAKLPWVDTLWESIRRSATD